MIFFPISCLTKLSSGKPAKIFWGGMQVLGKRT